MSDTRKHLPKPDRFTRKHRTAAHQARTKRVLVSLRETNSEKLLPPYLLKELQRRAGEGESNTDAPGLRKPQPKTAQ